MSTQLTPRYQKILKMRIVEGLTFAQIAEKLRISRQRVWQMYSRAVKRDPSQTV